MVSLRSSSPWDLDPRRWSACLRVAELAMLSAGWSRFDRKFSEVQLRRARSLWRASC